MIIERRDIDYLRELLYGANQTAYVDSYLEVVLSSSKIFMILAAKRILLNQSPCVEEELLNGVKKLLEDDGDHKKDNPNAIKIAAGLCIFRVAGQDKKSFAKQLSEKVNEMHFELPNGYIIKEIVVEKK